MRSGRYARLRSAVPRRGLGRTKPGSLQKHFYTGLKTVAAGNKMVANGSKMTTADLEEYQGG